MVVCDPEMPPSRKLKIVLWPKGNVTLSCYLPAESLSTSLANRDTAAMALRFVWFRLYQNGLDCHRISLTEWRCLAAKKLKLDDDFAYYLYTVAQGFEKVPKSQSVDLLWLGIALAFQGSQNQRSERRDSVKFVRQHADKLLLLCLLFDLTIAKKLIATPKCNAIPNVGPVDVAALRLVDAFLEGTVIDPNASTNELKFVRPMDFSSIALKYAGRDETHVDFDRLYNLIVSTIQSDMYALDEFECQRKLISKSARTLTSTVLPQHRKLTLRSWDHVEVLNNPVYRGGNLRIDKGTQTATPTSFIFHLQSLKTAVITDCVDISPIVLGVVTDFVILKGLKNCRISCITKRMLLIDCEQVTVFVEAGTRPIVVGNSVDVCFAPYNVWFDALTTELALTGFKLGTDYYRDPVFVHGTDKEKVHSSMGAESIELLPLDDFYLQPTPFLTTKPHSMDFIDALNPYYEPYLKRRAFAKEYIQKLTQPEIELISPLSRIDISYLKKKAVRH
uniref:TBCC domain-containing protein n=2 Tax=Panagrellus redivivus TaxID=6233 RepID=A0A7E4UPM1_PANRE